LDRQLGAFARISPREHTPMLIRHSNRCEGTPRRRAAASGLQHAEAGRGAAPRRRTQPLAALRRALLLLACGAAPFAVAGAESRSVLVLDDESAGRVPHTEFMAAFQDHLASTPGPPITIYTENLHLFRFDNPEFRDEVERWLRRKYAGKDLGAVVPVDSGILPFAIRLRSELWPDVPLIVGTRGGDDVGQLVRQEGNATGVAVVPDVEGTLQAALAVSAGAAHIAYVAAAPPHLRESSRGLRQSVKAFAEDRQLQFIGIEDLSLAETAARLSQLPPRSVVFYDSISTDGHGQSFVPRQALERIAEHANAPIFCWLDTFVGSGATGGSCVSPYQIGKLAAQLTEAVLARGSAEGVPVARATNRFVFDYSHIERFGLNRAGFPPYAQWVNSTPSLWESHRKAVVASGIALALQAFTIGLLLESRRRRQTAENAVRRHEEELVHADRVSIASHLAATLAHELNQPLTALINNAHAGRKLMEAGNLTPQHMHELLAEIAEDSTRADQVIRRLRAMMRDETSFWERLSVNDVIQQTLCLARSTLHAHQVSLATSLAPALPAIRGDRIQLEQILMNLIFNACDAMEHMPESLRHLRISSEKHSDSEIRVRVEDAGSGILPETLDAIFEPFHSTKADGLGLGLSISRYLASAHGGSLWAVNNPAPGATFILSLPIVKGQPGDPSAAQPMAEASAPPSIRPAFSKS
jgi:signal transduction histidine kinase